MKKSKKKEKPLTPIDLLKLEIAKEIGLLEKVEKAGWKGLTAGEAGRIGGLMSRRLKNSKMQQNKISVGNN